jgi:nitrite reductase/ring-hydroxylating ferredoxin subunit/uncharacterized membrane protein
MKCVGAGVVSEVSVFPVLSKLIDQQTWLDTLGDPLQKYVNGLFTSAGDGGKQLKNFLNGTWLGHPLHPMLTDVPIGAWTCTMMLDTLGAVTGTEALEAASDLTLAAGLAAASGAAASGLTDWSDTFGRERKVGLLHGLMMVSSFVVYSCALLARLGGNRRTGVALANLGYGLAAGGAYLGGEEVFDIGYGVNHTAFQHGPRKFVPVMKESELAAETPTKTRAGAVSVMVVKVDDRIYGLDDTCVHAGCSLSGGKLEGSSIICPCHGSQYDLSDGSVINGPATMPEPAYEVRVREGVIEVKKQA